MSAPQTAPQVFVPQDAPQAFAPQNAPQAFVPQAAPQAFDSQAAPQAFAPQAAPQAFAPHPARQAFAPQPAPHMFAHQTVAQPNKPLRYAYYGYLLVIFGYFIGLLYLAGTLLNSVVTVIAFANMTVWPLFLGIAIVFCAVLSLVVLSFGFIGIRKLNYRIIFVFIIFIGISTLITAIIAISSFSSRWSIRFLFEEFMADTMVMYQNAYYYSYNIYIATWDYVQNEFNCCGTHSYLDWQYWFKPQGQLPVSCCYTENICYIHSSRLRMRGCLEPVIEWFDIQMFNIGCVATSYAVVQVIGALIAIFAWKYASRNAL